MTVIKPSRASSKKLRKKARKLTVNELYGAGVKGGLLQGRFGTPAIYAWFQNRHRRGLGLIDENGYYHSDEATAFGDDHSWKVPPTVWACLKQPLTPGQVHVREPWYVTWISPKTGKRNKKRFGSPIFGIHFITTKAQYVDPHAALVSRQRTYDVPTKYRGKFPYKQARSNDKTWTWYWCPLCMQPRRFFAVRPVAYFYAIVKRWDSVKEAFKWADRKLVLLECRHCGCTNRDSVFRRSNQPWETRRFKSRVTRARRRRR